jgi:MFS family permease
MSSGGYVVFSSFAPVYLAEQGVTQAEAGLMVSILSWLIIVTIPLGGYLVDQTGQSDKAIWIGCLVAAAAIAMIPVGGPIIVWIVLSAALGITVGAVMALPSEVLSTNSRATGMGVFYTLYYAGTAGLPALAGWLHEITGNVEAVIWFSAVCLVLSPITLLAFRKLQQRMAPGI